MDVQELNHDRKLLSGATKINKIIDRGFSIQAQSCVNNHAIGGAAIYALPLFGLDNIIYAIVLWHMYISLCKLAGKTFGSNVSKSFIGGFIVNILVSSLLELACNVLPIVGGIIGGAVIGFFSIKISAALYLKGLEITHHGNVAEKFSFRNNPPLTPPPPFTKVNDYTLPPPPYTGLKN